jgi:hypothetical protein
MPRLRAVTSALGFACGFGGSDLARSSATKNTKELALNADRASIDPMCQFIRFSIRVRGVLRCENMFKLIGMGLRRNDLKWCFPAFPRPSLLTSVLWGLTVNRVWFD